MKRHHLALSIIVILALFVSITLRPDLIALLFALVFLGFIPGTTATIPSWVTLGVMTLLVVAGVRWIFDEPVYRSSATPKDLSRRAAARRKVLRRTRRFTGTSRKTALAPTTVEVRAKI